MCSDIFRMQGHSRVKSDTTLICVEKPHLVLDIPFLPFHNLKDVRNANCDQKERISCTGIRCLRILGEEQMRRRYFHKTLRKVKHFGMAGPQILQRVPRVFALGDGVLLGCYSLKLCGNIYEGFEDVPKSLFPRRY